MNSRFFNRLSRISSQVQHLKQKAKYDRFRMYDLTTHKDELNRIYSLIETTATQGYTQVCISCNDPVWNNKFVLQELRSKGFEVNKYQHSYEGIVRWERAKK